MTSSTSEQSTSLRNGRPRIALLADQLTSYGGSERVFSYMIGAFPEADVFSLTHSTGNTLPELAKHRIHTHWAARFLKTHTLFKLFFPYSVFVMKSWTLGRYDVILSSSATTAKYLPRHKNAKHICYCYIPTRAIWQHETYFGKNGGIAYRFFRLILPLLKRMDIAAAQRVDRFIAISEHTRTAIREIYNRDSEVLFSPIPVEYFREGLKEEKQNFFLLISRLEKWKRIDYAIEAFNQLGLPLFIVGEGPDRDALEAQAASNIRFLGRVSNDDIVRFYGQARAVVFTPVLEYGLVPIEAIAAGTPVITLDSPGVRETLITDPETPPIAIFFKEQSSVSLIDAVRQFQETKFDRESLSSHADKFSIAKFQSALRKIVLG